MRLFHELVFQRSVSGTEAAYSELQYNDLLGRADELTIVGFAEQAGGTAPTVTIRVQDSFDNDRWAYRNATAEISQGIGGASPFVGISSDGTGTAILQFARLRIALGGTSPSARLVIWVTGRSRL